jgi:hypothetical protein
MVFLRSSVPRALRPQHRPGSFLRRTSRRGTLDAIAKAMMNEIILSGISVLIAWT